MAKEMTTVSVEKSTLIALKQLQLKMLSDTGERFSHDELITMLLNNFGNHQE